MEALRIAAMQAPVSPALTLVCGRATRLSVKPQSFSPLIRQPRTRFTPPRAKGKSSADTVTSKEKAEAAKEATAATEAEDEEEEYEEVSWISEKFEDAREATQGVISAVPGPRVGSSGAPWLLVVPAAYLGLTFVLAVVRTIQRFNSPRGKRKRQVSKNAGLVESIDEALLGRGDASFTATEFKSEAGKFGFAPLEVVRKYVRYALNEKPFSPQLVASLIQFRMASGLTDDEVVEVFNDIARRTVKAKGRVMMDTAGITEKGLQRKAAVQGIFSKLLYLSELDEFCSPAAREKLEIKSTFGVTEDDVDQIRIVSLSSSDDLDRLESTLSDEEPMEPAS